MRKTALLLAGVLVLAVGSLTAGVLMRTSDAGPGEDYYERGLETCNPGERGVATDSEMGDSQRCLADLMTMAFEADDLEAFLPVLERKVAQSDTLYTICHPAAHIAGRAALDGGPGVIDLLDVVAVNTVCDWGFGHGVIDSLAERGRDDQTLEDIVSWCDKHQSNPRLYELCSDSVGHYSWTSTQDLVQSIENCETLEDANGVTSCGGGIMMQLFEPAASAGAYDREDAGETIPQICATWFAVAKAEGSRNGCAMGAGYIFGLDLRDIIWPWLNSSERASATGPVPREHQDRIVATAEAAYARCGFLDGESHRICGNMIAGAVPYLYASSHPEDLAEVCSIFDDEIVMQRCLERKDVGNI